MKINYDKQLKKLKTLNSDQLRTLNLIVGDMIVKHQFKKDGKCIKLMQDLLDNVIKIKRSKITAGEY